MPIYEYRCEQGHTFEVMRRMTDDPLSECVTCAAPVEQVFHPITVHFKGTGFYNTDYGTRKRAREVADSKESVGTATKVDGAGGDGKSGDAKPSSESKPSETKTSDAKPAAAAKPASSSSTKPSKKSGD